MGKSSIIFWTVFCLLICQIWAPLMTGPNDYNGHILSRLFAGLFGSVVGVVGPRILVDIFFLHERGRRFAIIFTANVFGSVVGPTLSGFISARTSWPVEYWWTVGLLGIVLILCFIFLEETGFAREESCASWPKQPDSFIANRIATFFLGQRLQPSRAAGDTVRMTQEFPCYENITNSEYSYKLA
jgi:MFS family permease